MTWGYDHLRVWYHSVDFQTWELDLVFTLKLYQNTLRESHVEHGGVESSLGQNSSRESEVGILECDFLRYICLNQNALNHKWIIES